MSDDNPQGQEPAQTEPTTTEPEGQPDPQPGAQPEPQATETDDFPELEDLPEGQEQFDREYVQKLRDEAAKYRVKAKAAKQFSDETEAEKAARVWQALQTEEGVAQLFVEAGQALGLNAEQLEALFGKEGAEAVQQAQAEDAEEGGEENEIEALKKEIEELKKAQTQTVQQQREAAARQAATEALAELDLDPSNPEHKELINQVLTLGQNHLAADEWNPEKIKAAVKKGHEELQSVVEQRAAELLKKKKETADAQPGSVDGGASPGGEPAKEPQNMKEAKAQARKSLGLE